MKPLIMVSLSLLIILSGLKLNSNTKIAAGIVHRANYYWHKRVHKELLRDTAETNTLREAIDNSLHFITSGFTTKQLPF